MSISELPSNNAARPTTIKPHPRTRTHGHTELRIPPKVAERKWIAGSRLVFRSNDHALTDVTYPDKLALESSPRSSFASVSSSDGESVRDSGIELSTGHDIEMAAVYSKPHKHINNCSTFSYALPSLD